MFARDYVADLAARGRHHFTTDEAVGAIGSPRSSVRAQLRRLKVRGGNQTRRLRRRSEFKTTEIDDAVIAKAANMGLMRMPRKG